ncbi:MAG: hypothetical protein V7605_623 [Acidimicrobiaceae bacterium]|jgi:hypothetical protein
MSKLRASLSALTISAVGVGGLVLWTAPAGAGIPAGTTTLSCVPGTSGSGAPLDVCTLNDPDGIRTVLVNDSAANQRQVGAGFDCSPTPTTSFEFRVPANKKYKVFVSDCSTPRIKTTFVIHPDGSVTTVGTPA